MHSMNTEPPSFIVGIPMYNEVDNVKKCVEEVFSVLHTVEGRTGLVAINDGSRDNTLSQLLLLQNNYQNLYLVNHETNMGYGKAINSAYDFSIKEGYEYIIFMDADLTQDPQFIKKMIPKMREGIDYIKASRYIKGSKVIGVPKYRILVSTIGNILARIAFRLPITDYTNGFRAVKTSIASHLNLTSSKFEILIEEIWQIKYLAESFDEISYELTSREFEEDSKFSYSSQVYLNYLKYCYKALFKIKPPLI